MEQIAVGGMDLGDVEPRRQRAAGGGAERRDDGVQLGSRQRPRLRITVRERRAGRPERLPAARGRHRAAAVPGRPSAALAAGVGELDARRRALRLDEADDARERVDVAIVVDAQVLGADAAFGATAAASVNTAAAPPTARLPRCTRCQSVARPSSQEYWHIGETRMR